jgi:hypothetical protein
MTPPSDRVDSREHRQPKKVTVSVVHGDEAGFFLLLKNTIYIQIKGKTILNNEKTMKDRKAKQVMLRGEY